MATDPAAEAEAEMVEQAKWGLSRSDQALVKAIAAMKQMNQRLKALDDRVKALEAK